MNTRVCRLHARHDLRIETDRIDAPRAGEVLVAIAAGGICGSDIHYLTEGGIGSIRVRDPIILGHEASGRVVELGPEVKGLTVGCAVAINPSRPCGSCAFCRDSLEMHCINMRFNGSALRVPHEQGLFRDLVTLPASQCLPVPPGADLGAVACAEPLAVCLHAVSLVGSLSGLRVLITGAGPIGALCTAIAHTHGAAEILVTDIQDGALEVARRMGATRCINVTSTPDALAPYQAGKGHFDIALECSAAPSGIAAAIHALRPRGTLVQIGVAGDTALPLNVVVAREIRVQGTHRFHAEFARAVDAIVSGSLDVRPIITDSFPLDEAHRAFAVAADRSRAVKVQLSFAGP